MWIRIFLKVPAVENVSEIVLAQTSNENEPTDNNFDAASTSDVNSNVSNEINNVPVFQDAQDPYDFSDEEIEVKKNYSF